MKIKNPNAKAVQKSFHRTKYKVHQPAIRFLGCCFGGEGKEGGDLSFEDKLSRGKGGLCEATLTRLVRADLMIMIRD